MANMAHVRFSKTGLRAVADPLADLFKYAGARAAAYTQTTGQEFISLAAGTPDPALLPTELYTQLVAEALADSGPSLLNYGMPQGLPLLRDAMEYVLTGQGIVCDADTILITSGGMEALSMGAWMVLNPGDLVIAEGPGFAGALSSFELLGARVMQLDCREGGIDPTVLAAAVELYKPKLVSLMPDYQNPTGSVMPLKHRKAIGELLRKHDLFALEDGAYSQLHFETETLPPLQSFAPEHVLYATSVSKILAPAMRIGALVAPKAFIDKATDMKSAYNMQASAVQQGVTARFLRKQGGHLGSHVSVLRKAYRARRDAMIAGLKRYFPSDAGFSWTEPGGGMFLWLQGPETLNFTALFATAVQNGVAYVPGSAFYAAGSSAPHNAVRLNFASTPEQKIGEAIRRLAVTASVGTRK